MTTPLALDPEIERIAQRIAAAYRELPACDTGPRLLVAIAGRPGSGKSTLVRPLTARVNELVKTDTATSDVAVCVGLDGWHYSRAELDAFDDPKDAHWWRGAAHTFDLSSYSSFIAALRPPTTPQTPPLPYPTFDHAAKDPAHCTSPLLPTHRVILLEGLYTMYDAPGWRDVAALMDLRVWVDVPREVCYRRVLRRNLAAGIVADEEGAKVRVDAVDMVNGDEVAAHRWCVTDEIAPADWEAS